MGNVANVTAGKPSVTGPAYCALLSSSLTIPTDASSTVGSDFSSLGFLSDAGLVNGNSPTATTVKSWGGSIVLTTQTDKPDTFKFTLIETKKAEVKKAVYGSKNVTVDETSATKITTKATIDEAEEMCWVFDMITRDNGKKRLVIPRGTVTAMEDITYADSSVVGYGITVTAVPDSNGVTHYDYEE